MPRLARWALALVVALSAALVLPVAYTGAGEDDAEVAPGTASPEATVGASSTPAQPTPSPTETIPPEPTVSSSAPAPPTDTVPTEEPRLRTAATEHSEDQVLDVSLSASPSVIEIGDETAIHVQVANPVHETAEDVDVVVVLPVELAYVSAVPSPSTVHTRGTQTALEFSGLTVPAGGTVDLFITARAVDQARAAVVQALALWAGDEFAGSTNVAIEVPPSDLTVASRGPRGLIEVGERVRYDITMRNEGDAPVEAVSIVNLVPREVHVVSVGMPPGIDAVQVGQAGNGAEDVVWALDEIDAGEAIEVSYSGVVEDPGDLKAVNETRLLVGPAEVGETRESAYLAASRGQEASNPAFEPIVKKKVIRQRVTEHPLLRRRVPTQPGSLASSPLPFSGIDPSGIVAVSAILIGLGLVTLNLASGRDGRRRVVTVAFLLLIVGAAGVANDAGPNESSLPEGDTRVKGREITRGEDPGGDTDAAQDGNQAADDEPNRQEPDGGRVRDGDQDAAENDAANAGDAGAGAADDEDRVDQSDGDTEADGDGVQPGTEEVLVPGPPVTRIQRRARVVTITEDDLPIVGAGSVRGARPSSFGWDDVTRSLTHATSSSSPDDEGLVELTTEITPAGKGIRATVTLQNLGLRTRTRVSGRLSLTISGGAAGGTLRSNPVDVVLNPEGETTAAFNFRLPSGSYTARPTFRSG